MIFQKLFCGLLKRKYFSKNVFIRGRGFFSIKKTFFLELMNVIRETVNSTRWLIYLRVSIRENHFFFNFFQTYCLCIIICRWFCCCCGWWFCCCCCCYMQSINHTSNIYVDIPCALYTDWSSVTVLESKDIFLNCYQNGLASHIGRSYVFHPWLFTSEYFVI